MTEGLTSPLFPLNINVLPGALLPLQIFEPRYIDMVRKCLGNSEGFCVVLAKQGYDDKTGLPSHHNIATYVEIVDFDQLDNGLLGITVRGKDKIKVQEKWKEDDDLLVGKVLKIEELDEDLSKEPKYRDMWNMVEEITNHPEIKKLELDLDTTSSSSVCYILASVLPIQPIEKQTILELDSSREKLDYLKGIIKKLGG